MLDNAIGLFWIIIGFGGLIFVHELGHFLAAKWAGIRAEGFAIGMGPVLLAWRKGIGVRFGSTLGEYERITRERIRRDGPDDLRKREQDQSLRPEDLYRVGDEAGLGETEYSLRWLPIGGFVKMLGQEDANPSNVSSDPRSYNRCPIGKRMVVVSAGVIMNVLLAAVLFVWAFLVGVRLEAPVIGDIASALPAGTTVADNAQALGISEPGLQPGDRVVSIDGDPATTFADIQIASAMSRRDQSLVLAVSRPGLDTPLQFTLTPQFEPTTGLRSIGVAPGRSTTLLDKDSEGIIANELKRTGLAAAGIGLGDRLLTVNGQEVSTYEQLARLAAASDGQPLTTRWTKPGHTGEAGGDIVEARLGVLPGMQLLQYPELSEDGVRDFERGLIGLSPLVRIREVPADSHNRGVLRPGDVVLRLGDMYGPREMQFRHEIQRRKNETLELEVLRNGQRTVVEARVNRKGMLGVLPESADDLPLIAQPLERIAVMQAGASGASGATAVSTPIAPLRLMPLTTIVSIDDRPVGDWRSLWIALRELTQAAHERGEGTALTLTVAHPTPGEPREDLEFSLTADEVRDLHELTWHCEAPSVIFDAIYTVRSADGDPLKALLMGVQETHKLIMMTYLTIDRLLRRTVPVEQLRGPVGIFHIGVNIADRGFIYVLFFLGMISVNLAVINFLPLPIVDGGLFLFLVYEKLKGRPPSVRFQEAVTIVGLVLIATMFIVVTYNDVMRLFT